MRYGILTFDEPKRDTSRKIIHIASRYVDEHNSYEESKKRTDIDENSIYELDEMLEKARNITIEDLVGDFCYE